MEHVGKIWQRPIIVLVLGLLLGFIAGHSIARVTVEKEVVTEETVVYEAVAGRSNTNPDEVLPVSENVIEVKDQKAGDSVFISRVILREAGWVAVHEDTSGELGNILGAKWFDRGQHQGTVPLLRNTASANVYHATLWHDDGDHEFEHEVDTRLTQPTIMFEAY